jgi:hypothetical protein
MSKSKKKVTTTVSTLRTATKRAISTQKSADTANETARKNRWLLGQQIVGVVAKDTSTTVRKLAIANNAESFAKTDQAMIVFFGEAIAFFKKHKTVESAMKATIKGKGKGKTSDKPAPRRTKNVRALEVKVIALTESELLALVVQWKLAHK